MDLSRWQSHPMTALIHKADLALDSSRHDYDEDEGDRPQQHSKNRGKTSVTCFSLCAVKKRMPWGSSGKDRSYTCPSGLTRIYWYFEAGGMQMPTLLPNFGLCAACMSFLLRIVGVISSCIQPCDTADTLVRSFSTNKLCSDISLWCMIWWNFEDARVTLRILHHTSLLTGLHRTNQWFTCDWVRQLFGSGISQNPSLLEGSTRDGSITAEIDDTGRSTMPVRGRSLSLPPLPLPPLPSLLSLLPPLPSSPFSLPCLSLTHRSSVWCREI